MKFNFAAQRQAWATPPVAGGNMPSHAVALWSDELIRLWVAETMPRHYAQPSNHDGEYLRRLRLDDTSGKVILDFGCGFGFDALRYARAGNEVMLADIAINNIAAAARVLTAHGHPVPHGCEIINERPFIGDPPRRLDVIHCSGVLHHIPYPSDILRRASEILAPDGEVRLMLYTDHLFRVMTGQEPGGIDDDVTRHPRFAQFVRGCDAVGHYADWYTPEKLAKRCAGLFDVAEWHYLRPDKGNAVAILRRS